MTKKVVNLNYLFIYYYLRLYHSALVFDVLSETFRDRIVSGDTAVFIGYGIDWLP